MENKETFDVTNYEKMQEAVIPYMDYLPEDENLHRQTLWNFIWMAFSGRGGG